MYQEVYGDAALASSHTGQLQRDLDGVVFRNCRVTHYAMLRMVRIWSGIESLMVTLYSL